MSGTARSGLGIACDVMACSMPSVDADSNGCAPVASS